MAGEKKFAVLIDADNVSDKYIKFIMDEISNDGVATYKRIYGDWTKPVLASWKSVLLDNSIMPVQQYAYTVGKNATDSAMIIDAMDILYSGHVDGFCLVSSDSDFTRLASRLRESGMTVVGMGERKTPGAFIAACNKFKYLDVLASAEEKKPEPGTPVTELELMKRAVLTIVTENSDEDGWAFIGDIGNVLIKRYPDFDVRNFGFSKLTPFIKSMALFDDRTVRTRDNNSKLIYIRAKQTAEPGATPAVPPTNASQATPAAGGKPSGQRRKRRGRNGKSKNGGAKAETQSAPAAPSPPAVPEAGAAAPVTAPAAAPAANGAAEPSVSVKTIKNGNKPAKNGNSAPENGGSAKNGSAAQNGAAAQNGVSPPKNGDTGHSANGAAAQNGSAAQNGGAAPKNGENGSSAPKSSDGAEN